MTTEEIFEKVRIAVAQTLGKSPEQIEMSTTFQDVGMDSLDGVSLISEMEEEFEVDIPNEEIFKITSVEEVVQAIKNKL